MAKINAEVLGNGFKRNTEKKYYRLVMLLVIMSLGLSGCGLVGRNNSDVERATAVMPESNGQVTDEQSTSEQEKSNLAESRESEPLEQDCIVSFDESNNRQQRVFNELVRTGEFVTSAQMKSLKEQALSWQSAYAGMGSFVHIVVLEPLDSSGQQVYISFASLVDDHLVYDKYEKILIQSTDGTEVRILGTSFGAGSGEINLVFKFITDDYEWIEVFSVVDDKMFVDGSIPKWSNITDNIDLQFYYNLRQFK